MVTSCKKRDTPATLIIGGKDENHLFLGWHSFSKIQLISNSFSPPFKNVDFKNSRENKAFQQITNLVYNADSIAAESTASKRHFIENQLQKDLLLIADTSDNFLVSLYSIHKTNFESNYSSNPGFYKSYINRWRNQNNAYFEAFSKEIPIQNNANTTIVLVLTCLLTMTGFFVGKFKFNKNRNV